jgi:hypothetical protein
MGRDKKLTPEQEALLLRTEYRCLNAAIAREHFHGFSVKELRKLRHPLVVADRAHRERPLTEAEKEALRVTPERSYPQKFPGRSWHWLRKQKRALREVDAVPDGFFVKGESILYDDHGFERARWVKTSADRSEALRLLIEKMKALAEPARAALDPIEPPDNTDADLLAVYPMGDPHVGMYAWSREAGTTFNREIAERNIVAAVDRLSAAAPAAERGLILNLGDYLHSDNYTNRTTRSGAALDVDGRWPEILEVGVRALRRSIDRALFRHQHVDVICLPGNHDDQSAIAISLMLSLLYEREPRVRVDTSPAVHRYVRFGRVLLGTTHGHAGRADHLGQVMAADRPVDWGETEHRYWYCGHVHHDSAKEVPGCKIETFRTLAPRDAYHAAEGYRSGRDMKCIVLHRQWGEIERHTVNVAAL